MKKNEKISAPHCKPEPSCCKHGTCHKSGEYCCCTVSSKFYKLFLQMKKRKKSKIFRENRYHFKVCQYGH